MIRQDGSILLRDRERGGAERRVNRDTLVREVKAHDRSATRTSRW